MRYTVDFKASAAKDMRRLSPEIRRRVADRIDSLKENPRPPGVEKLAEGRYRVRAGSFFLPYNINNDVASP
jgi:mRNA interferase RelE/StbE